MNLLVIDDDKAYLKIVQRAVDNAFPQIDIKTLDCGNKALEYCQNNDVDLILLDVHMPKTSGIKVAKLLQHTQKTKNIPIVFVTATSFKDFAKEGFALGSVDYIFKPIDINLLINRVGLYLTIIEQNLQLQKANKKLKNRVIKEQDKNKLQEEMLIHQSKTSVMGEMIGAIAHQWRQPLNIIATSMINLETKAELDMLNLDEIKRINGKINTTLQGLSKTIDDFRNFFLSSEEKKEVDIVKVVLDTIELVKTQFTAHGIDIVFEYHKEEQYMIDGYFNELRQVVLNIFANSKDAIENNSIKKSGIDGKILITLKKDDKNIKLSICDNGGGIDQKNISKVFNPYFSTKFASQGTGIGLYLTKSIVEKFHDGKIDVSNKEDGACFDITFKDM